MLARQLSHATEQTCQEDCMRPKREGLCPTAPILARRYVDPRQTPTGVDIGDQIDKRSFNLQYRRVDFTYCKGSKFENISQYTAQVWPIDELPDDHEDKTVYYKKIEPFEWFNNATGDELDKNGHYELNFTGLAPLGTDSGNYYRQIDEEKPEPYSDSNLTFPYYGNTFETAHLSSNGYITFGGLAVDSQGTFSEIFEAGYPRISAFFAPLAPENISMINAGANPEVIVQKIRSTEADTRLVITFNQVPTEHQIDELATFQVALYPWTGQIRLAWTDVTNLTNAIVGLTYGGEPPRPVFDEQLPEFDPWPQANTGVFGPPSGGSQWHPTEFERHFKCTLNEQCVSEEDTRLVGPTRPSDKDMYIYGLHQTIPLLRTRPHPWIIAEDPNPYTQFCKIGCTYYYNAHNWANYFSMDTVDSSANSTDDDVAVDDDGEAPTPGPTTTTGAPTTTNSTPTASPTGVMEQNTLSRCMQRCDYTYRFSDTTGYNDVTMLANLECYDGCQIANLRCQPGYSCFYGMMEKCVPGTYRPNDYHKVEQCFNCPKGRYRQEFGGRDIESCSKCPVGKYVNETGSDDLTDCLRCPAGRFAPEPGLMLCKCIPDKSFPGSCEWEPPLGESLLATKEGVNEERFFTLREKRDTVPYKGRF